MDSTTTLPSDPTPDPTPETTSRGRRLAVVAAVAAAAAAAILVPLALVSLNDDDQTPSDSQGPSASPQPSASPSRSSAASSPSASPTPAEPSPSPAEPQQWEVTGLGTGTPPALPYLVGDTLHVPGAATLDVDGDTVGGLARMSDGRWLVSSWEAETGATTYELRDAAWALLGRFPGRDYESAALTPTGDTAAWARPDGRVLALQAGAAKPTLVGSLPANGRIRAVRGTDCASDCVITGDRTDPDGRFLAAAWEMGTDGGVRPLGQHVQVVNDSTDDALLIGLTEITDDGTCSALVDLTQDSTLWRTCDNTLDAFSPDGSLLLASEAYHDGWGSGEIAVYDTATGVRLLDLVRAGRTFTGYQSAVWEDDSHLLVTTHADGAWAIVRIAVDGSMEYAVAPRPGSDLENPFRLVGR